MLRQIQILHALTWRARLEWGKRNYKLLLQNKIVFTCLHVFHAFMQGCLESEETIAFAICILVHEAASLQALMRRLSSGHGYTRFGGKAGMKYDTQTLIKTILLAADLGDDGQLSTVVERAFGLALPDSLANHFIEMITNGAIRFPSSATISKYRLMLDVGYMLFMRALHTSGDWVSVGMMDASPFHGRDWLMQHSLSVRRKDLPNVFVSVTFLTRTRMFDVMQDGDMKAQRLEHSTELMRIMDSHTLPPTALGSGRASVVHKLAASAHSQYLEAGTELALRRNLDAHIALTTDQGTESLVADLPDVDIQKLLPYLAGAAGEDADVNLRALDGEPESKGDERLFLFQYCLVVPGLLHILHGATEKLMGVLKEATAYMATFNVLVHFLGSNYHRDRLVATCFNEGQAHGFAHLFRTFQSKVAEWRWGTLIAAMREVILVWQPLASYWNPAAYNKFATAGSKEYAHDEELRNLKDSDGNEISTDKITEAILSKPVEAFVQMCLVLADVLVEIGDWAESCPCHSTTALKTFGRSYRTRARAKASTEMTEAAGGRTRRTCPCPMVGRLAHFLAAGKLASFLEE